MKKTNNKTTLQKMGISWFVSFAYHIYTDENHMNWMMIPTRFNRMSMFINSKEHHTQWLNEATISSPKKLGTNTIGLTGNQIRNMAATILKTR